MILSVTLSKPTSIVEEKLGRPYEKIKIKIENSSNGRAYFLESFTKTQVFHSHYTEEELNTFIEENAGKTFKNCVIRTENEETSIMANKKGKVTKITRTLKESEKKQSNKLSILPAKGEGNTKTNNNKKNYILEEGNPVPFLVLLGIMNSDGKVIKAKYDKFRQINRFLEFINDILEDVIQKNKEEGKETLRIVDFGCGKSYLTFAVHYLLNEIKHVKCSIEGLDLKQDVIDYCNDITKRLNLKNLIFHTGNIADYSGKDNPDIVITLHACNTATDFALQYAVEHNTKAILSVPCCQHEVNLELQKNKKERIEISEDFTPLLKWGIIREKFSSLVTDALRGEWLESKGYKVQMLEFIDMEHTPKNILIRAVKKSNKEEKDNSSRPSLLDSLHITPTLLK